MTTAFKGWLVHPYVFCAIGSPRCLTVTVLIPQCPLAVLITTTAIFFLVNLYPEAEKLPQQNGQHIWVLVNHATTHLPPL